MDPVIEAVTESTWRISVERTLGQRSATGNVVVRQKSEPQIEGGPYIALAGARAWLALSKELEAADDPEGALSSVQAGLDELGEHDYSVSLRVSDDSSLHIDLANELAEEGQVGEAADRLSRALETRLELYARLHAETIAE